MGTSVEKPSKLAKLNDHFEQFSSTTALHGFGFIVAAKCMEEKLLWLCLTIIAAVLMVYYCNAQIVDYYDEPTVTEVFVNYDSSISFPSPTVCIAMNISQFHVTFDEQNLTKLSERLRKWRKEATHKWLMSDTHYTIDSYHNDTLNWLAVMARYLGAIVQVENTISEGGNPSNWTSLLLDINNIPNLQWLQKVGKYASHLKYNGTKVTHSQLMRTVAYRICEIWDVRLTQFEMFTHSQNETELPVCSYDSISWFGQIPFTTLPLEVLCSFMPPDSINLTATKTVRVSARPLLLYDIEFITQTEMLRDFRIYISTSDRKRVVSVEESNDILLEIPFNDRTIVNVELQANYSAYNTAKRSCVGGENDNSPNYNLSPPQDERSTCRANVFAAKCNCWPLAHFALSHGDNLPDCTEYFGFANGSKLENPGCFSSLTESYDPKPDCSKAEWLNTCILNQFSFALESLLDTEALVDVSDKITRDLNKKLVETISNASHLERPRNSSQVATEAYLVCRRFSYPLFREKLKKELKDLIADIGGTIGVWIGASFLALIHVIVFVISVLPDWFCPKVAAKVKGSRFVGSLLCRRKVEDSVLIRQKYRSAVEALQQEFTSRIEHLAQQLDRDIPTSNGAELQANNNTTVDENQM